VAEKCNMGLYENGLKDVCLLFYTVHSVIWVLVFLTLEIARHTKYLHKLPHINICKFEVVFYVECI
jgi:hypothetical protein